MIRFHTPRLRGHQRIGYIFEAEVTEIEMGWLVRGGRDYDRERLMKFGRIAGEQDYKISTVTDSDVRSSLSRPEPFSHAEDGAAKFTDWYIRPRREPLGHRRSSSGCHARRAW